MALVARLVPRLTPRHFAWQALWDLLTSTFALRGRRGAWRHRRCFCVASVALMDGALRWAGSGGALGPPWSRLTPWAFAWHA